MRRKLLKLTKTVPALAVLILLSAGIACATPGFGPVGPLYTGTKVGVYGTSLDGTKTGEACTSSILGIVALGDGTVEAAASNGGITQVKSINLEGFSILGVYATLCTIVAGD